MDPTLAVSLLNDGYIFYVKSSDTGQNWFEKDGDKVVGNRDVYFYLKRKKLISVLNPNCPITSYVKRES